LLVVFGVVIITALAASLVTTASAARTIAYPKPRVGISASASASSHVGDQINFQALVYAGRELTFQWDFGDGAVATGASTSHVYSDYQQGGYMVTLTATDPLHQQMSVQKSFTLLPPLPQATFTYSPDQYNPLNIYFDATNSTGVDLSFQWDFGDGNTSQDPQPENSYAQLGTYTVRLTVTDVAGQTSTTTQQVVVRVTPPTASFTSSQYSYDPYFTMACYTFDASASTGYNVTYNWDFGDGNTESDSYSQTSHCYYSSGSYTVTLTVTDAVGQSKSTSQNISF